MAALSTTPVTPASGTGHFTDSFSTLPEQVDKIKMSPSGVKIQSDLVVLDKQLRAGARGM
jgi:hypothetical protein